MVQEWIDGYRETVRAYMIANGEPVVADGYRGWYRQDPNGDPAELLLQYPEFERDGIAARHVIEECQWRVAGGRPFTVQSVSVYSHMAHGETDYLIAHGGLACACGKYENVTIRWEGTVEEIFRDILSKGFAAPIASGVE